MIINLYVALVKVRRVKLKQNKTNKTKAKRTITKNTTKPKNNNKKSTKLECKFCAQPNGSLLKGVSMNH